MSIELVVAVFSAIAALASVGLTVWAQSRITKVKDELIEQRNARDRRRQAKVLYAKYRDPLARAADGLQSRLYNIKEGDFLSAYYNAGTEREERYAIENTMFVIADYFGWVEILRREFQSPELEDDAQDRRLNELLEGVAKAFSSDQKVPERHFQILRGEQRAIGELMLTPRPTPSERAFDLLGFAEFSNRLKNPEFRRWFQAIDASLESVATSRAAKLQRLIDVQHALIDLIDLIDPDGRQVPKSRRSKIEHRQRVSGSD